MIFNVCYVNMGKPRLLMNTDVFFVEIGLKKKTVTDSLSLGSSPDANIY